MIDADRRALDLLGLAARAGSVVSGTDRVRAAARSGRVRLVVVAADASASSRQKLVPLLVRQGVPVLERFDRSRLGAAIGRSLVSAVALGDEGLAGRILMLVGAPGPVGGAARRPDRR